MTDAEQVAQRLFKLETSLAAIMLQRGQGGGASIDACVAITERIAQLEARQNKSLSVEKFGAAMSVFLTDVAAVFSGIGQPTPATWANDPFPTKATLAAALEPLRNVSDRLRAVEAQIARDAK